MIHFRSRGSDLTRVKYSEVMVRGMERGGGGGGGDSLFSIDLLYDITMIYFLNFCESNSNYLPKLKSDVHM